MKQKNEGLWCENRQEIRLEHITELKTEAF